MDEPLIRTYFIIIMLGMLSIMSDVTEDMLSLYFWTALILTFAVANIVNLWRSTMTNPRAKCIVCRKKHRLAAYTATCRVHRNCVTWSQCGFSHENHVDMQTVVDQVQPGTEEV